MIKFVSPRKVPAAVVFSKVGAVSPAPKLTSSLTCSALGPSNVAGSKGVPRNATDVLRFVAPAGFSQWRVGVLSRRRPFVRPDASPAALQRLQRSPLSVRLIAAMAGARQPLDCLNA
jgi:hypothetical protein